jgi:type I restriction enzyme R subunit
MLLTGFDAKRLKKMYLGRVIRKHNLLQTLTRVNRPYHDFQYGFVVDFADIRKEFDATNQAYFNELQAEVGDELEHYSNLFKSKEEIDTEIEEIKDILFNYDTKNAEIFSQQINQIDDRSQVLELKKALGNAKSLYNLIRLLGHRELLEKADFHKLNDLYKEVSNRLDHINLQERLKTGSDTSNLLNEALEDVVFSFRKLGQEELVLADQLKNTLRRTRETLQNNVDQDDPQFVTLREELVRLLQRKNINEVGQEVMNENIKILSQIYKRAKELNRQNNLLREKYDDDYKYVCVHKRIQELDQLKLKDRQLHQVLMAMKNRTDDLVLNNQAILNNEQFFSKEVIRLLSNLFRQEGISFDLKMCQSINKLIVQEYLGEWQGENHA